MNIRRFALLSIGLAACSSNPQPAGPAPAPAPAATAPPAATASAPAAATASSSAAARDVGGTWDYSVDAGGQTIPGEMTLTRSGNNYTGMSTPQGMGTATIRSVTMTGDRVVIMIDSPDGEISVEAVLSADGRSMAGIVNYQGQQLPFNARKR